MPRRDGHPTDQELAAQRAGRGPDPIVGGQLAPRTAAIAALNATRQAAHVAATAPPVIAPALTVAAVNAAAAGILGAFGRFLDNRRRDQEQYVTGLLEAEIPDLPDDARLQVVADEMDRERAFAAKARDRLDRDLPKALMIPDFSVRETEVQKVLDRERRYAEQREMAMATRTLGAAEQRNVERVSPEGGYWRLSPHVRAHTLDCLAFGGKVWPHSVLRTVHPPLHGGCPCEILSIQEAQRQGLIHSDAQWATHDQAIHAMQIVEAEVDAEEFADELAALEAAAERWWKGTAGPGRFRSRHGDVARGLRHPRPAQTGHPTTPEFEHVPTLEEDLDVRDVRVGAVASGDRFMVGGDLATVKSVLAPGVFELEDLGVVRVTRDVVLGVASCADAEPPAPASTTGAEPTKTTPVDQPADASGDGDETVRDEERETLQVVQEDEPRESESEASSKGDLDASA